MSGLVGTGFAITVLYNRFGVKKKAKHRITKLLVYYESYLEKISCISRRTYHLKVFTSHRGVAQLARASVSKTEGRRFESCLPCQARIRRVDTGGFLLANKYSATHQ